jgi:hypothetical protein
MRITSGIKIHGTHSFRLACTKLLGHYGTNLQNSPPALLRCIIPSAPDRSFVQPDQSGAESLVVAMESEPGLYRRIIEAGMKQHVYIALHIFVDQFRGSYPRDRYWKKDPFELVSLPEWPELNKTIKNSGPPYDLGKMSNHARSYRMKWPTFQIKVLTDTAGEVVLSNEESKSFLELWDDLFPEVVAEQSLTEHTVRTTRTLTNLFGFPRTFYGRMNDELIRDAISWVPQSTVGCITHEAVLKFQSFVEDKNLDWELLGQKHDSYLAECPDAEVLSCCAKMREFIEQELVSHRGVKFKMKSGVSVGKNLGKYDKNTNPFGMKEL